VSLDSLVPRRIGNLVHRRGAPSLDRAADTTVADARALPTGSMRVLEGAIAMVAIITALLIGMR